MADWLSLVGLIPLIERIRKRPKLEITPKHEKSHFYQKCQFNELTGEIGKPIGTVLELCLNINNKGKEEAKVKHFYIKIKDIFEEFKEIEHIERNAKGRIPSFRTCPTAHYPKGKTQVIAENKKILVNDSDIINIQAGGRTHKGGYLYFHIEDNISEDREPIQCILRLKYGRRKAEGIFNLKREDC